MYVLNFLNKKRLYQYIKENNYKYVITTHLFAAQALTAIKKEYNIKFMQIATDYVCIPFWEETNPDYFIIPHEEDLGDIDENENIIDLWQPLEFNIDKNYEYVPKDKLFLMASNLIYYVIAYPILKILMKIIYDFKIEGRENIKNVDSGAISVSNHVLFLDCAMVGLSYGRRKIYYTTQEESFKIPFVRKLIKLLRAIPIPKNIENRKYFIKAMDEILMNKDIIHFYPEAALWPYCDRIRKLKNGAFDLAVRNNVLVIPIVFTFRKPTGIRRIFKFKKDVTLKILKPIKCEEIGNTKQKVENLKEKVFLEMKKEVEKSKEI